LGELFEVSDDPDAYMTMEHVKFIIDNAKLNLSPVKIGRTMTKLGWKSVVKKIDKKSKKVYPGIRQCGMTPVVSEEY